MANADIEGAVRTAAKKLENLLGDASKLTVTTNYVIVGTDPAAPGANQPALGAKTEIALDGDWTAAMPVQQAEGGGLEREDFLFEFHQENVKAATEYRAKIIGTLIEALRSVV